MLLQRLGPGLAACAQFKATDTCLNWYWFQVTLTDRNNLLTGYYLIVILREVLWIATVSFWKTSSVAHGWVRGAGVSGNSQYRIDGGEALSGRFDGID